MLFGIITGTYDGIQRPRQNSFLLKNMFLMKKKATTSNRIYGCVYFVPVIGGWAARHNITCRSQEMLGKSERFTI